MKHVKEVIGLLLFLVALAPAFGPALGAQAARPLTEEGLVKVIELQLGDDAIVAKIKKDGVGFPVEGAVVARLKAAGASDAVLEAVRSQEGDRARPAAGRAVAYDDVLALLKLGIPESEVLKRLAKSPTVFILDVAQVDELKRAGASGALLAAMRGTRRAVTPAGEVTDLAIILDCSGSMAEVTREGASKMATARRVVIDLVRKIPDGMGLAFVLYGHDKARGCEAVEVARSLSPLDSAGKAALIRTIEGLRPAGATPIALSLRTAGAELAHARGPSGVVLITDGKETCNGDPAAEANALARGGSLTFGLNVVGFDVEGDERAALEEIARAGKGKYYHADSAARLQEVIQSVRKEIEVAARPIESIKVRRLVRTIKVLPPKIELPPMEELLVVEAGVTPNRFAGNVLASGTRYGEELRLPADSKVTKFDVRWSPKGEGRSQVIAKGLTFGEINAAEIRPEDRLGLVQVVGTDLPRPKDILLVEAGAFPNDFSGNIIQSCEKFGTPMAIAAGVYDLYFTPATDGRPEKLVESLEVKPGKLIKVE